MINYLFYFIGILIGLLIMLIIVYDSGDITRLFKNTKEFFGNAKSDKAEIGDNINIVKIVDIPPITSDIDTLDEKDSNNVINGNTEDHFNFFKLLKRKEFKVMISSYNNDNIKKLDWITDNKDSNNGIKLKLSSNEITKELNELNPLVNGYNIYRVSIEGPSNIVLYNNSKAISTFSILFMFKFKGFSGKNNNLFTIYGIDNKNIAINIKTQENNSTNIEKNEAKESINLLNTLTKLSDKKDSYDIAYLEETYTIDILIEDKVFNIKDIKLKTLKKDIVFLGLIVNKDDVVFYFNNTKHQFKRKTDEGIKVNSNPFVINKDRSCEIVLYSFAFLNEAISDKDLETYKLYNKYKLYGIDDKKDTNKVESKDTLEKYQNYQNYQNY
jgi:hypothetical protein